MPKYIYPALLLLAVLGLIPAAMLAKSRVTHSPVPRLHAVFDMDHQPKFKTQMTDPAFADDRAMRLPVPGTVARGDLDADTHFYEGKVNGKWATTFPMPVTMALLKRGQNRFEIYCSPCHGYDGYGDGMVAKTATQLKEGTWTPPADYHTDDLRSRPVGNLFNTITNGIRHMPAYGPQIPPKDRWAIVAYLRALQLSQHAPLKDVPPEDRSKLR